MIDPALKEHLESGGYIPSEFRDFHELKDLFKAIGPRDLSTHPQIPDEINFRRGMIYVVDHFLHFMAIHGYELRKVEDGIPRKDLQEAIQASNEARLEKFRDETERRLSSSPGLGEGWDT